MVKHGQVRKLRRLLGIGKALAAAARTTDMSEKTARKFRDHELMPSQHKLPREYRTRIDLFEDVWPEVQRKLEN